MSYRPYYKKGDWKALCEVCGRIYKSTSLKQRWDGLMVCPDDFETRQPQDFVRGVADVQSPPWTRPEQTDTFVNIQCTTRSATVGIATIGCAIVGDPDTVGQVPLPTFNQ